MHELACLFLRWAITCFIWVLININAFQYCTDIRIIANYPDEKRGVNISGTRHFSVRSETSRNPSPSSSPSAPSPKFKILHPKHPESDEKEEFRTTSCTCGTAPLVQSYVYEEQLSLPIPWLNLTSRQILAQRHPNFPHSLTANTSQEWCHLLPPPHT